MLWTTLAFAASVELLGDAAFRPPDGIADAAITDDGSVWTLSPRGEIAGFTPDGELRTTFQACPDRSERIEFTVSADGSRLGLACATDYRLFDLPSGRLLHTLEVDVTHSALSLGGRLVGILGERYAGGVSEEQSWLLVYDVRSGEIVRTVLGEYDEVFAVQRGWVLARGNDAGTELSLVGIIGRPGDDTQQWSHDVDPSVLAGGGWTPRTSLAVRQRGANLCITHDGGGTCLAVGSGRPTRPWVVQDRPFPAPGPGSIQQSPGGRHKLEVLPTHIRREPTGWKRPVEVVAGGGRVLVLDTSGHLFDARTGADLGRPGGSVALSPNGRWLWTAGSGTASARRDLTAGTPPEPLPLLTHAVVTDEGTVHGLVSHPEGARFGVAPPGAAFAERGVLGRVYEPTSLQVEGTTALVAFTQDDRYITFDVERPGTVVEGRHAFGLGGDVLLAPDGVLTTEETARPRTAAGVEVPDQAIVRFLPQGRGIAILEDDARRLVLKALDGTTIDTVALPARGDAVWSVPGGVVVALRDGRLAVVTAP